MLRKLIFSALQLILFTTESLKGRGKFGPKIIECGWPHSVSRAKFLVVGTVEVHQNEIFCKVLGGRHKLKDAPQRRFFQAIESGQGLTEDPYYLNARLVLGSEEEFQSWLRDKVALAESFKAAPLQFIPIAVRDLRGDYIVEDGAHRLSLQSLLGYETHTLGISLWDFKRK